MGFPLQKMSLTEYFAWEARQTDRHAALVDPDTRRIDVFRPQEDGLWKRFHMSNGDAPTMSSVSARIPLATVFDGMDDGQRVPDAER